MSLNSFFRSVFSNLLDLLNYSCSKHSLVKMAIFQRSVPGYELLKPEFEWKVVNLPFLQHAVTNIQQINSPAFFHEEAPNKIWTMSLLDQGNYISIRMWYCCMDQVVSLPYPLLAEISLLNKKRKKVIQNIQSSKLGSQLLDFQFSKKMVIESGSKQENDSLTFLIKLKYHLEKEPMASDDLRGLKIHTFCKISDNQQKLFEEMLFTDVIFLLGEREFPAHKSILASRSTVFSAMFNSASDENSIKKIPIQDIEPEVFHELLRFMYTGIVLFDKMESCAVGLFIASKTFSLRELTERCENFLLFHMSPPHCLELLLHGDLANPSKHVSEAANFFRRNAVEVMGTDGWKKAKEENPISLVKIHEFLYCQRK